MRRYDYYRAVLLAPENIIQELPDLMISVCDNSQVTFLTEISKYLGLN